MQAVGRSMRMEPHYSSVDMIFSKLLRSVIGAVGQSTTLRFWRAGSEWKHSPGLLKFNVSYQTSFGFAGRRSDTVFCTAWDGVNWEQRKMYAVTSLDELRSKAVTDNLLSYRRRTKCNLPLTVVCGEDGREIKSMEDLRRCTASNHNLLLIGADAPGTCLVRNYDRAAQLILEFLEEEKTSDRGHTMDRWLEERFDDLDVIAHVPPLPIQERLNMSDKEFYALQDEAFYTICPQYGEDRDW